jgi:tRNA(Arg) A34 adenosine deaminase TadA
MKQIFLWFAVILFAPALPAQTPVPLSPTVPGSASTMTTKPEPLPDDPTCNDDDRRFMARAYELARSAVAHGNEPFGALLVKDGKIIFENENSILTTHDVTQHGETGLISKATPKLDAATLAASTMYTSTEPCNMCCGAIRWAGIHRVVYGTTGSQMNRILDSLLPPANPINRIEVREQFARTAPQVIIQGPLLEAEGLAIHESYWPDSPRLKRLRAAKPSS